MTVARELLEAGVDSGEERREQAAAEANGAGMPSQTERPFEAVACEWCAERKNSERWDEGYAVQVLSQFEGDVFPIKVTRGLPREAFRSNPLVSRPVGAWPSRR